VESIIRGAKGIDADVTSANELLEKARNATKEGKRSDAATYAEQAKESAEKAKTTRLMWYGVIIFIIVSFFIGYGIIVSRQKWKRTTTSLFEKKEYERGLGKYQESFRKNIDARNGAEKLNDENSYYNKPKDADKIREYVLNELIETARATGDTIIKIRSGDIGKKLGLYGRMPNVCQVLHGKKFQELCSIKLLKVEGPEPSTTTV
jgi:asparagine synthetase A